MATATMRIDRPANLGPAPSAEAGGFGFARTDALPGEVITLNSLGVGDTHRFRFLMTPDMLTQPVQTPVTGRVFTFPTQADRGAYRIELIVNEGQPDEAREIRILGVRDLDGTLSASFGERADPAASLERRGAAQVKASENNEKAGIFPDGNPYGWVATNHGLPAANGSVPHHLISTDVLTIGDRRQVTVHGPMQVDAGALVVLEGSAKLTLRV